MIKNNKSSFILASPPRESITSQRQIVTHQ